MARIATVDKMVKAIQESERPALTKQDIADAVGVSWQTINNHEAELKEDPRVESGKIGKAQVFWLAGERPGDTGEGAGGPNAPSAESPPESGSQGPLSKLFDAVRTSTIDLGVQVPVWLFAWAIFFAASPALVSSNLLGPSYLQTEFGVWLTFAVLAIVALGLAAMVISIFMRASAWLDERAAELEDTGTPPSATDRAAAELIGWLAFAAALLLVGIVGYVLNQEVTTLAMP